VSLWLLAFSSLLFLALATVKRVAELVALPRNAAGGLHRRGYGARDIPLMLALGVGCTFSSAVVLILYVQSEFGAQRVWRGEFLWAIVPLVLFWQCRIWLATSRGYMRDDPIVYAAGDWVSWIAVAAAVLLFTLSALKI
jgi:hypothetical protein